MENDTLLEYLLAEAAFCDAMDAYSDCLIDHHQLHDTIERSHEADLQLRHELTADENPEIWLQ